MKKANIVLFLMISSLITIILYYQIQSVPIEATPPPEEITVVYHVENHLNEVPDFEPVYYEPIFLVNKIDDIIYNRISDVSFKDNNIITIEDLRYLKMTYWGYDGERHTGEMIVHHSIADEVLDIFKELYDVKYPIEKMVLVDDYDGDDNLSMADNNSSAFNYRYITGTSRLSNHAYGLAIDINPIQNPYITSRGVEPIEGEAYVDRQLNEMGMIKKDDPCYIAFTSRGWEWGGEWARVKDYQHFEKYVDGIN